MTVNDEIGLTAVHDDTQLAIAQHPVLAKRLAAEGGSGRSKMEQGDAHVRVQGQKGALERLTLPATPNGKPLQCARVDRIRTLVWPEPPTATHRAGDAHARSVGQAKHSGAAVEHFDARAFEHPAERYAAQRSEVVVAKHRDDGQSRSGQELTSQLGFEQAAVLGEVASDQQEVGVVSKGRKTGDSIEVFTTTNVEVSNSRHANPEELRGGDLRNGRWQLTFHGTEAYPIAREPRQPHRILRPGNRGGNFSVAHALAS